MHQKSRAASKEGGCTSKKGGCASKKGVAHQEKRHHALCTGQLCCATALANWHSVHICLRKKECCKLQQPVPWGNRMGKNTINLCSASSGVAALVCHAQAYLCSHHGTAVKNCGFQKRKQQSTCAVCCPDVGWGLALEQGARQQLPCFCCCC